MASIGENYDFDAEAASKKLRDAMDGIGTDEDSVISILGSHCNAQLLEVKTQYTAMFGRDLIDDLQGETKGYFEELCVALVRDRWEFLAHLIHDALSGVGTTEQIIVDIFGTISPAGIETLKEVYDKEFGKTMQEDITSDVGGYFERFLISIMSGGRNDDGDVDSDLAAEDAQKLYDAGEGTFGTDECAFMSVFMTRSFEQLRETIAAYDMLTEDEEPFAVVGVIKNEFTGSEERLLSTIVRFAIDPRDHYIQVLRDCMEGIGTSDRRLLYTIVDRAEIDLAEIRDAYSEIYEEDLSERIKSECGEDLGNLLALLVNGNQ